MTDNAISWENRAKVSIAHGALTNSKRPQSFVHGVYPTHLAYGKGCHVYDAKNKRYIDFICGLGVNLFGYAHPEITRAAYGAMLRGSALSLGTTLEVEFAETIKNYFPFVERIRVLKSGSEGCSAAVRMARAATGRDLVLSEGYHGWHDTFAILTPPAHGCPQGLRYDIDTYDPQKLARAACVIVEPFITDHSAERITWLQELRSACTREGAVLIFDETITGLRFPGLSVAKFTGIYPDLIIFGKALGGGLPISVVGGRKAVMEADYFVSSTFAGDPLPMAAAMKVLPMANEALPRVWDAAERFQTDFNQAGADVIRIEGYPTRGVLKAPNGLTLALFMQEAVKAGLLFGPSFFWCEPHATEAHTVLSLVSQVCARIKTGAVSLEGALPLKPYAQKVRE